MTFFGLSSGDNKLNRDDTLSVDSITSPSRGARVAWSRYALSVKLGTTYYEVTYMVVTRELTRRTKVCR